MLVENSNQTANDVSEQALAASEDPSIYDETDWAQAERYGSWRLRMNILRFLHQLAENHRLDLANYLRVQTGCGQVCLCSLLHRTHCWPLFRAVLNRLDGNKEGISINLVEEVSHLVTNAVINFGPIFYVIACELSLSIELFPVLTCAKLLLLCRLERVVPSLANRVAARLARPGACHTHRIHAGALLHFNPSLTSVFCFRVRVRATRLR